MKSDFRSLQNPRIFLISGKSFLTWNFWNSQDLHFRCCQDKYKKQTQIRIPCLMFILPTLKCVCIRKCLFFLTRWVGRVKVWGKFLLKKMAAHAGRLSIRYLRSCKAACYPIVLTGKGGKHGRKTTLWCFHILILRKHILDFYQIFCPTSAHASHHSYHHDFIWNLVLILGHFIFKSTIDHKKLSSFYM